jgi:hypothetical protein
MYCPDEYKNNPLAMRAWKDGYESGLDQGQADTHGMTAIIGIVFLVLVLAIISGCSDAYRYPCQDPANQAKPECAPPECVADGTCTDYLVETHK